MADSPWQRMPKARRAAVYRAIGRAARDAREDDEPGLVADLRIAMNVLRSHARTKPATRKGRRS